MTRRSTRSFLAAVIAIILLGTAGIASAQPAQPMRILPGSYAVGGGGGGAGGNGGGGGIIPAECGWSSGAPPTNEQFVFLRGNVSVQRYANGQPVGAPVPLDSVLDGSSTLPEGQDPWLRIVGDGSTQSLYVEPVSPLSGEHFVIEVGQGAMTWDESAEWGRFGIEDLNRAIEQPLPPAIARFDRLIQPLLQNFDPTNPLLAEIRSALQDASWRALGQAPGLPGPSWAYLRQKWKAETPELTLGLAETVFGHRLSGPQRASLSAILDVDLRELPETSPDWRPKFEMHPAIAAALGPVTTDIPANTFWTARDAPQLLAALLANARAFESGAIAADFRRSVSTRVASDRRRAGWHGESLAKDLGPKRVDELGAEYTPRVHHRSRRGDELGLIFNRLPGEVVGWGDLITIRLADNSYCLVDTGLGLTGIRQLIEELEARHPNESVRLLVVMTHQDADHYNKRAIEELCGSNIAIEQIVASWRDPEKARELAAQDWIKGRNFDTAAFEDQFDQTGVSRWLPKDAAPGSAVRWTNQHDRDASFDLFRIDFDLGPFHEPVEIEFARWRHAESANQSSLIMHVRHNGVRRLLTGDLDATAIDALLAAEECRHLLAADELKWPHHCEYFEKANWRETVTRLLREVDPTRVVLSNAAHKKHLENAPKIESLIGTVLPNCEVVWTRDESRGSVSEASTGDVAKRGRS